jgi:hypothetical protein
MLSGKEDQEIVRVNHCGYIALKNFYGFDKLFNKNQTIYSNNSNNQPQIKRNEGYTFYNAAKFRGCLSVCATNECNKSSKSFFALVDHHKNKLKICIYLILYFCLVLNFFLIN